jgi:hypothetical protein
LVYQMCGSIWAVNLFVFAHASVTFAAHMQQCASVAVSTQHFFFASYWGFQNAQISLIRLCNMQVYTHANASSCGQYKPCRRSSPPSRGWLFWFGSPGLSCCTSYVTLPAALSACRTRERTYPMNMKGKANKPKHVNTVAKSNMPYFSHSLVLL